MVFFDDKSKDVNSEASETENKVVLQKETKTQESNQFSVCLKENSDGSTFCAT